VKTWPGRRASSSNSLNSVALKLTSSDGRPGAGDELGHLEGLGHVVVGAELQPDDDVHGVALGGEHDDRDPALRPDLAADLISVEYGEHDVEDDEVERRLAEVEQSLSAVGCCRHVEPGLGQAELCHFADGCVVLHQE
jgi:hypothetical protein